VFEELSKALNDGRISVERVEVWETPRSRAMIER